MSSDRDQGVAEARRTLERALADFVDACLIPADPRDYGKPGATRKRAGILAALGVELIGKAGAIDLDVASFAVGLLWGLHATGDARSDQAAGRPK